MSGSYLKRIISQSHLRLNFQTILTVHQLFSFIPLLPSSNDVKKLVVYKDGVGTKNKIREQLSIIMILILPKKVYSQACQSLVIFFRLLWLQNSNHIFQWPPESG